MNEMEFEIKASKPTNLIPVKMTKDGGTDGDATKPPLYTYGRFIDAITGEEIKNADGSPATKQSPAWRRNIGSFVAATRGTICINSDGNPKLWEANELEEVCVCDECSEVNVW